ncbi:MAG: response regulator transcription factor [Planctomycetota bacterium]|jgi:two-component system phosphate regulon response regulator PhoB
MNKENILVIEDEPDILELISYNLIKEGYNVATASSGEDGLKSAETKRPDLIVLDLMLPGIDGLKVCKEIRNNPALSSTNIIMLTAKGEESDIVIGLELGADDYIVKPFSPKILLARISAVLRRKETEPEKSGKYIIKIHDFEINPNKREVTVNGKHVELTFTEFGVLYLLARKPGWVFTRNQILDAARGENALATDRAVDVQVVGLRKKLGSAGLHIETVRSVGYRMKEE